MPPNYVMYGGITLDWIINPANEAGVRSCGGNVFYAGVAARLWSDGIAVVSRCGSDFPEAYLQAFREAGIDVSGIRRIDEPHELIVAWRYDASGNRQDINPPVDLPAIGISTPEALEDHPVYHHGMEGAQVTAHFDPFPDEVPDDWWQAKGFHVAGMRFAAQQAAAHALREHGLLFSLDPGSRMRTDAERQNLLTEVPILLPSEKEAFAITGERDMDRALDHLAAYGAQAVVVKLGPLGSLVYDARRGSTHRVPVFPSRAKDPTGAGDAYCGGFMVGYSQTGDALEAALRAIVSSSFVIEEFDSRYGLRYTRHDAEVRLAALRTMIAPV